MSWGIWQQLKHWSDVVWDDLMPGKTSKHLDINIPLNRWDAIISRHNRRLTSVVREFDSQSWTCAWGVIFICNIYPFSWMECYYVRIGSASLFAQLPAGAHWLPLHLNHLNLIHSFLSLSLYESLNPHNGFCKKGRSWQTVTHTHFLLPLYHQFVLVCLNLKLSWLFTSQLQS